MHGKDGFAGAIVVIEHPASKSMIKDVLAVMFLSIIVYLGLNNQTSLYFEVFHEYISYEKQFFLPSPIHGLWPSWSTTIIVSTNLNLWLILDDIFICISCHSGVCLESQGIEQPGVSWTYFSMNFLEYTVDVLQLIFLNNQNLLNQISAWSINMTKGSYED